MSNFSKISVAILSGGQGTRLASILPGQQKVVAEIKGHPFLEYILKQLNNADFKNIVFCIGYLGDQVRKAFGNNFLGSSLYYSQEDLPLGTAGAVVKALPFLKSEDVLIMNGDSFFECDLQSFYNFHLNKGANVSIILKQINDTSRYGRVRVDKNSQVVNFEEKRENRGHGFINGGIYFIKKSFILKIPKNKQVSFEKEIFPSWIGKGMYGFESKGRFIDIGTPESYEKAQEFFS